MFHGNVLKARPNVCNALKDVPSLILLFLGYSALNIVKVLKAEGGGKGRTEFIF